MYENSKYALKPRDNHRIFETKLFITYGQGTVTKGNKTHFGTNKEHFFFLINQLKNAFIII